MGDLLSKIINEHLCIGCGLCESVFKNNLEVKLDINGMYTLHVKENVKKIDYKSVKELCPVLHPGRISNSFWGEYESVYFGYSKDSIIRHKASSGGVISSMLTYLLESGKVNAVIHIGASKEDPLLNLVYVSTTREQVMTNSGSRYAPVKLLSDIENLLNTHDSFALVGKPCDIRAFENYKIKNPKLANKVKYEITFFCGGVPSLNASYRVLKKMQVPKENLNKFEYRGNGWPGLTTAYTNDGKEYSMAYAQSWGEILGRDIHKYCKFCIDGLGECADINCGDGWYGNESGYPSHEENNGRNVIIVRNTKGLRLLKEMADKDLMELSLIANPDKELVKIQPGQQYRKSTLISKVIAMKVCRRFMPKYDIKQLKLWSRCHTLKELFKVGMGTVKRLYNNRL